MRAKEVSYRRVFSLGNFETETYSVTVELEDRDESVQLAIEAARKHVEMAHAKVMSEKAKPERVEKGIAGTFINKNTFYGDGTTEITNQNYITILKAIESGKADINYINKNFRYNADIRFVLMNDLAHYQNNISDKGSNNKINK